MVSSKESNPPAPAASFPPTLPPSVEQAYRKKCIELKRRMNEVEETNEVYRLRKSRLVRGIRKMRLERAILLETLGKRMRKHGADGVNGMYDDESEGSSEGPPTPQEKPLRSKRGHRRPATSPRSASTHHPTHSVPTPHHQPHSSFSTPIAPHPGPSAFSHTNGTPLPGPFPHFAAPPLPNVLGPPPARPPLALDLFIDHVIAVEIPTHTAIHPQGLGERDAHEYARGLWRMLSPSDREEWEVRGQEVQEQWAGEMRAWEDMGGRLVGLRGGEAEDGEGEGDGDMEMEGRMEMDGVEEEREEVVEGGFTAVNS